MTKSNRTYVLGQGNLDKVSQILGYYTTHIEIEIKDIEVNDNGTSSFRFQGNTNLGWNPKYSPYGSFFPSISDGMQVCEWTSLLKYNTVEWFNCGVRCDYIHFKIRRRCLKVEPGRIYTGWEK